jgi:hypothetical protein
MRVMLAGLLIGCTMLLAPPPMAHSGPPTCPPTCDQIPAAAWPDPGSLPLDSTYHWPVLGELAAPVVAPRFRFEELCASPPVPNDPRAYAVAARAVAGQPDGQWQVQALIVHWRGETWRGGQLAGAAFDTAVAALRACQVTAPQFSPLITTTEPNRMAAVISGPVVAHQFMVVDPRSSTISELVFSHTAGSGPVWWPAIPDAQVLDAMAGPLCAAYLGSCG